MKTTREIGDFGEDLAEKYLKRKGYKILSRNFSARGGEIDIIGYRFGSLVFFEVKTRSNDLYGTPASAVDDEKVLRIGRAANVFVKTYLSGGRIPVGGVFGETKYKSVRRKRIDIIEVYLDNNREFLRINHIKEYKKLL